MSPPGSRALSAEKAEELERRIARALAKYERGEPLTDHEQLIAYWLRHGEGCHACGGKSTVGVAVAVNRPGAAGDEG